LMKQLIPAILLIGFTTTAIAQQKLDFYDGEKTFVFPNKTNEFVAADRVNWALDTQETFSFRMSKNIQKENIFNYIVNMALLGKLKGYELNPVAYSGFEELENSNFSDDNRFARKKL